MALINKSIVKTKKTGEVLKGIYNNEIPENALKILSKENLSDFILEIFNKGVLNNYLRLID
ncbi:hypothetical protein [Flavobacterium sp. UBA6046]|jgi:hypothetical protein|uniref:hypothetical protein n=1 Tax=Flavobacterium sp. UBA6046 TaxID=1946552 RepID=UPI0025BACB25|nr:hypothetical protein [Flavobacterium sp. UBA6046]